MAEKEDYIQFITDQLSDISNVEKKKMFGGIGFFKEGTMFAMIGKGALRLRADKQNEPDFESRGMTAFMRTETKKGMPYWEVPVDVLEDKAELTKWAENAYAAALRAKK